MSRHLKYECAQKRSFECTMCEKAFMRNDKLSDHLRGVHGIFPARALVKHVNY